MNLRKISTRIASAALATAISAGALTSCNYLDVVPAEQVTVDDAMENYNTALGFLYSCYAFSKNVTVGDLPYGQYMCDVMAASDEVLNPHAWNGEYAYGRILLNTLTAQNAQDFWGHNYNGVGQCLLFLEKLETCKVVERGVITEEMAEEWRAEIRALRAYYHFNNLRRYGPIVILEEKLPLDAPQSAFPGRMHYDYCVDWIVEQLDAAAEKLPAIRPNADKGRMTSTICKALKAKVLLLAASPLYNGSFPYPDFKNDKWETPGYGKELISKTYDPSKWTRALAAVNEAINWAETKGERSLYYGDEYINAGLNLRDLYVPGNVTDEFKEHVMRMRYLHYACEQEGNREAIMTTTSDNLTTQWFASFPKNIQKLNNGTILNGYSGVSPTLNAVKSFLTADGYTIDSDPSFPDESEWYQSAGLPDERKGRSRIINLHVGREPRFYAWIAFDGGDYSMRIKAGQPLHLNMISKDAQGFSTATRDNSPTGYLNQKFMPPTLEIAPTNYYVGYVAPAKTVIRLAELYLIRAECEAMLGMTDECIDDINVIRNRAGAAPLTASMVGAGGRTLIDWVKTEWSTEFFMEGQRFWNVRRWVEGDKYFGLGKRMGLNALSKENPTFEEFNQPTVVPYTYTWGNKLYLYPIQYTDVYADPQLVQNPGF